MNTALLANQAELSPHNSHAPAEATTAHAATGATDQGVEADEVDLTLRRPLADLPESQRVAVTRWLIDHHIDPARVALNWPVQRNEASSSVSWREEREDGLVVRHYFPAVDPRDGWPAPFPSEIVKALEPPRA